ncbi:alpha-L-arabinofuranosidase C-terminal domain-containing protein [Chitinophaga pinensis]|uniref:non-reducing end alpha-L-arabinofuranosidase n=1 Tax=Chitinophaga pinensis (strain ATCC 43595 / DSM 2588 / LMG 13176 / NBRC 15968 / NCIMB 11800 / UQM 2034) TaxID=485918 RepID=A0A979G9F2_CHIPD|nr:alpha-L-arabinofuranosidase C-terminal domain-containing protein [Chitinophaga pinensis]ACU63160.1 alpha-L-arabinofuranosidase domain protein [Chitinophaga pinensis DSM 2588]
MKHWLYLAVLTCLTHTVWAKNDPDSVYLFSYATEKNNHHNGLHFAWSRDQEQWHPIGNEWGYLKSDYGRWGAEKRMFAPYLISGPDGNWHCVWGLNDKEHVFAHAASPDLIHWKRQSYPVMQAGSNVLQPVSWYDAAQQQYNIIYTTSDNKYYQTTTKDFTTYSPAAEVPASAYRHHTISVNLPSGKTSGQLHRVPWKVADQLIKTYEGKLYKMEQYSESTARDSARFAGISNLKATITIQPELAKPISDLLFGVFFEDINYAADGGLYAELIQNRDFEYALSDKEGRDQQWTHTHSWQLRGTQSTFTVDTTAPLHGNNRHYAVLDTKEPGAILSNTGFDGISVSKGEKYQFSLFSKGKGKLQVRLVGQDNAVLAQTTLSLNTPDWRQYKATLTAGSTTANAHLELLPLTKGGLDLDLISLFPAKTFRNRPNGLRPDLAQTIADIHPRFIRFPGGCVAHGDGLGNMYRWKNTLGPLETRKPQRNLWGYHQSAGLGYFEYFQYCEDIGAEPLPVVPAGVPCQNSGVGGGGQQGGIPMTEMDDYVQEVLDLVEYANGNVSTTWGKKRAAAGHPAPFHLKYIGIGNEDLITDVFEERFTMIYKAMQAKHPEITVIGTVGPFYEGTDYEEGWALAEKLKVPMVDEHYYETSGWFINNQDFYDKYDRSRSKVYLGEYAAHLPGAKVNLETALSEAIYLTGVERNGDIVSMTSYAPLLAKEGHTQWNPDLIYFNNTDIKLTTGYQVQKLFGNNAGNEYLPNTISLSTNKKTLNKRIAVSVVRDSKTKDVIIKLVNISPFSIPSTIDLGALNIAGKTGVMTTLQGDPSSRDAKPVSTNITVASTFNTGLPAYSFSIIRIKTM